MHEVGNLPRLYYDAGQPVIKIWGFVNEELKMTLEKEQAWNIFRYSPASEGVNRETMKNIITRKSQTRSRIAKNLSATLIILVDLLPRKKQDVMCCKLNFKFPRC